jgi:AraC-like DNA-binding protein
MNIANWVSSSQIRFSEKGKHEIPFSPEFPIQIAFQHFTFGHRLTPSNHDYFEITYIYEGKGVLHVEDKAFPLEKGDVFIAGDTEFHLLEASAESPMKVICLYFLPSFIYSPGGNPIDERYLRPFYSRSAELKCNIPSNSPRSREIFRGIERLHAELAQRQEGYELAVKNSLCEMLLIINRYFRHAAVWKEAYAKRLRGLKRLKAPLAFIEANFARDISLNEVARIACMSPAHFCRFFKKVTGKTLTEYILRIRIDKAKEMLLRNNLSVSQIGFEVGFENPSYFHRIFRRFTRLTPREFLKTARKEKH